MRVALYARLILSVRCFIHLMIGILLAYLRCGACPSRVNRAYSHLSGLCRLGVYQEPMLLIDSPEIPGDSVLLPLRRLSLHIDPISLTPWTYLRIYLGTWRIAFSWLHFLRYDKPFQVPGKQLYLFRQKWLK
ncbi:hypothetical protein IW262DRAFT_544543 [Armillaria fumosa]|nr:hypothetical protein IW262DRAFT_544543 [Armillaria fumosa]